MDNLDIGVRYGSLLDPSITYFTVWGELSDHITELQQAIPNATLLRGGDFGGYLAVLQATRSRHTKDALYILNRLRLFSPRQQEEVDVFVAEGLFLDGRITTKDMKRAALELNGKSPGELALVQGANHLYNCILWGSAWTGGIPKGIFPVEDFLK